MSNDLVARLRLEASAGNTSQVLGAAARETAQLGTAGTKAAAGMREAQTATAGFERSAGGARAAGAALGAALGLIGGRELVSKFKEAAFATSGLTTGLSAVAGGALGAADAQRFVSEQSDRLGLVIRESTAGYLKLAAATNGTALAGQKTKDIWLGLNEAGTVLNLTSDKQANAMLAISQIASKGVVQQEDLRGQLAEALPGALQVAQRALGKTEDEFNKLVASGELLASDFLPKLATQLHKEFGPQIDAALTTPIGQARLAFADFKNTTDGLTATAGAAFLEGLTSGLQALNAELGSADTKEAAQALGKSLGEGLSAAAQGAAFLVDHLNEVEAVAGAVVAIGLAKWLVSTATEARGAAAAYLAKAEAAKASGAISVTTAQGEVVAVTSLRGAIVAAAQAEVAAATAARDLALANEQAAGASLTLARAQAANLTSTMTLAEKQVLVAAAERELATAQTATAAASARAQVAAGALATATTAGGAAAQGAKALFGGLMGLLGGPWGIALLAAAAAVAYVGKEIAESDARAREAYATQKQYASAMAQAAEALGDAATNTRVFGADTANAVDPTDKLTGSTRQLTDQTLKLADARRQAALAALQESGQKLQAELSDLDKNYTARSLVKVQTGVSPDGSPVYGKILASARRDQINDALAANMSARIQLAVAKPTLEPKPPKPTVTTTTDKDTLRAQAKSGDLEAARLAQEAYTRALIAGGVALDDWKVKEAGRQAVERLALADRPKLTEAEKALVAQIRSRAEETERLKIANERIEKAIGLQKTAEADTVALQRRAAAAAQGEAALEALQVKEAGIQALQQLGVDTLDQLTGATLDHAKAAIAAAEAKEKQSIATAKADRVAAQIRDLDDRIASELGYAKAIAGGTEALVAYQRQEFERQEIERAGKVLTEDQVTALRAKADALFAVRAAADSADLTRRQAEELRLVQMTSAERAIEERYLQHKSLLLAEHVEWTKEEAEARARALALADEAAARDAKAKGELKEGLKQAFIESGHLGFEDVGDFVERRLREAVYNALLAEPIDILINAVVGSVSGMNTLGVGSGLGQLGGAQGLGSLFTSAGQLAGLTTSATKLATNVLSKLGVSNASGLGSIAGGAIGGAGTGMLVSSVAGLLGLKQTSGNKIGSTIGGAIGSFIPIPGGAILGSIAGNLIGGLVGGKPSNHAAVASLDAKGNVVSMDGAKRNDQTTAAAQQVAQAVQQIQAALVAGGATLSATVSKIDIGTRDSTHLNFSNGQSIDTAVGDVSAAIDAATKTILANAKWASDAQTAYAQKMLAAGATIDQVVQALQIAGGFASTIDDAIAQLTDPAAYAKKQALDAIDANYQALKKQAEELITAGLATGEVLGKLTQLKDLQVADALKRLGTAADSAADALAKAAAAQKAAADFSTGIDDAILQLTDPVAAKIAQINRDYQAKVEEAKAMIAAGQLNATVLDNLARLRDLQIDDVMKDLAGSVEVVTDVFAEARPRLQAWLDSLGASQASPLNAGEQRQAAMASYERVLERARAGDADALSQITGLADQLLSSDRTATSSATDRLALYNKVQADIQGLAARSGSAVGATPALVEAKKSNDLLKALTDSLDPKLIALRPPAPMEVKLSPWLQKMHKDNSSEQTKALKDVLDKLVEVAEDTRKVTSEGLAILDKSVSDGVAGLIAAEGLTTQAVGGLAGQVSALERNQSLTSTYLRMSTAR